MEKEIDHVMTFLDHVANTHHDSLVTSTFGKRTFPDRLLTNYLCFAPLSYKIGLIRTLNDRCQYVFVVWLINFEANKNTSLAYDGKMHRGP